MTNTDRTGNPAWSAPAMRARPLPPFLAIALPRGDHLALSTRGPCPRYRHASALFSHCRRYRYALERVWGTGTRRALFIGLNPSTADASQDDATLRRMVAMARATGCAGLWVANLFAACSRDPRMLAWVDDPVGPENDACLAVLAGHATLVIAAWGARGTLRGRADAWKRRLPHGWCLGWTRDGEPRHPLYLRCDTPLRPLAMASKPTVA